MIITLIHGQNHQQTSYHSGRILVDNLENVEHVYEFFLPRDLPVFCKGCYLCMRKGASNCPNAVYVKPIADAIDASDLLIFTTPVYCLHTTAPMKSLLDHLFVQWMSHRPKAEMMYKKAVIICSGAGSGMKRAAKDIKDSLTYWGISHIQCIYIRAQAISWLDVKPAVLTKLHKDIDRATNVLNKQKKVSVSINVKLIFYLMRAMQLKGWSACEKDQQYWEEQGWLGNLRPWNENE